MRFLCDVHISLKISKKIEKLGFQSEHVNNILNKWNTKDSEIIDYADKHNLIVITKDQDFKHTFLLMGKPKKLIKVSLGNISNEKLFQSIESHIEFLNSLSNKNDNFMVEIIKADFWTLTN